MKRGWFSVERFVAVLSRAELGMRVADLTRQVGISEQTFYHRRQARGLSSLSYSWHVTGENSFGQEGFEDRYQLLLCFLASVPNIDHYSIRARPEEPARL